MVFEGTQVAAAAETLAAREDELTAAKAAETELQQRIQEAVGESRDLQQQLTLAQASAAEASQHADNVKAEAADQASRLAHLEGLCPSCFDP